MDSKLSPDNRDKSRRLNVKCRNDCCVPCANRCVDVSLHGLNIQSMWKHAEENSLEVRNCEEETRKL